MGKEKKSSMRQSLTSILRSPPAAFLEAVLLAYGIFIPWFGLYGDDWIYLHNYHTMGALSFNAFVAADRPFSGWIYILTTPIFGEMAWPYHIFLLGLRWLSVVLLWLVLKLIWPEKGWQLVAIGVLFAVFPGFLQQPIAVQYILHFSVLDLFLLSLWLMGKAALVDMEPPGAKMRFALLYAGALLTSLNIFSMEYFVGLELLRPVWIWVLLQRKAGRCSFQRMLSRVFRVWAPFLVVLAAFGFWRIFIFKFPTYQPTLLNGLKSTPAAALTALARRILTDLLKVNVLAWKQAFGLPGPDGSVVFFVALVLGAFALLLFGLKVGFPAPEAGNAEPIEKEGLESPFQGAWRILSGSWAWQAVILGVFSLLIAGWPFWFAGVQMETTFPWDRTMLPFMLGASLLLTGVVDVLIRPRYQALILAGLAALAIGGHYRNALVYRAERDAMDAYFWQLAWRAPGLVNGTIVGSDAFPLDRHSDNDLTPVLNWIYAPQARGSTLAYQYFDLSLRLGEDLPVEEDQPVSHSYRGFTFTGSTRDFLAVFNRAHGCLHILTKEDGWHPGLPETMKKAVRLSNLDVIQTNAAIPIMPAALRPEPEKDWCYYFESADLARQKQDWQAVKALWDQAQVHQLTAEDPFELLPFIEGFAMIGDPRAQDLSKKAASNPAYLPGICAVWQEAATSTDSGISARAREIRAGYRCN
jgi:hypothetical protein